MDTHSPGLSYCVALLVRELSAQQIQASAQILRTCDGLDFTQVRHRLLAQMPNHRFRPLWNQLIAAWQNDAATLLPSHMATMLLAASQAVEAERQSEIIDLVWTGPRTLSVPLRHTEQALLEVIRSAQRTLLIVSFAVYRAQTVKQALLQAAHRDVRVEICIEASERGSTHTGYDTTAALGADLLAATSVYVWPQAERITTEAGQTGSLHAKCAVADKDSLFVSSANLTDYAMNLNMELGVLIRGGNLPGQVRDQFTRLIENRILVPWSG